MSNERTSGAVKREAIYDNEIAPKLLELGKLAEANGMTFVAAVEWNAEREEGGWGKTMTVAADASRTMKVISNAVRNGASPSVMLATFTTRGTP